MILKNPQKDNIHKNKLINYAEIKQITKFFSLRESDNTVLGNSQNLIGVVYGVVVAFMIILSWQNYTNLNQTLIDESASLLAMWRDSRFFDDKLTLRNQLQKIVIS